MRCTGRKVTCQERDRQRETARDNESQRETERDKDRETVTDRNRQRQRYTEADRSRKIETETERPYSNRTRNRRETCEQAEKGKQADREADIRIGRKSIRRIDRQARQTSTATPRTRSCKRCAVGMEASATHPAYSGMCGGRETRTTPPQNGWVWCQTSQTPQISRAAARWTRLNFSIRTPGRPTKMELQQSRRLNTKHEQGKQQHYKSKSEQ